MHYDVECLIRDLEYLILKREKHTPGTHESKILAGAYTYIPLNIDAYLEQLKAVNSLLRARKSDNFTPSFIDVGCGIGSKLYLAGANSFKLFGLDIDRSYIRAAKKLNPSATLYWKDGRKHDYSPYDVIYFYCPMCNHNLQKELEAKIYSTAKKGAFILANLKQTPDKEDPQHGIKPVRVTRSDHGTIYRKV